MFAGYIGDNTINTSLSSAGFTLDLEDIPSYGCYRMFRNTSVAKGPKFPNLKSIGDYGLAEAFRGCSSLSSVEIPSTSISVGLHGCEAAFSESGIKEVENLNLSGIGPSGCKDMFSNCSSLTSVQDLHIDNSEDATKKTGISRCNSMFLNCDSLLSVGGLIKGLYGQYSLRYMF